ARSMTGASSWVMPPRSAQCSIAFSTTAICSSAALGAGEPRQSCPPLLLEIDVCWPTGRIFTNAGEGCGNCRAVETVEKRTACFSTVPTALGKLGKIQLRRVFHSSHSPYCYFLIGEVRKFGQLRRYLHLTGHYDPQSVKTIQSLTTASMAGF